MWLRQWAEPHDACDETRSSNSPAMSSTLGSEGRGVVGADPLKLRPEPHTAGSLTDAA